LLLMYTDDHGGLFPQHSWWTQMIAYDDRDYQPVRFCPIPGESNHSTWKTYLDPGWAYCMNIDLTSHDDWGAIQLGIYESANISEVEWTDRTMLTGDSCWRGPTFPHRNDFVGQTFFGRSGASYGWAPHNRNPFETYGVNFTFVDGHAEYMQSYWPVDQTQAMLDPRYMCNYQRFWGRPESQSWNLSPYDD